jgi:CcmD family protein
MDPRNFLYMFYGFLAAWLILIVYVVSMATRERKINRDIEVLRRMIDEREKKV